MVGKCLPWADSRVRRAGHCQSMHVPTARPIPVEPGPVPPPPVCAPQALRPIPQPPIGPAGAGPGFSRRVVEARGTRRSRRVRRAITWTVRGGIVAVMIGVLVGLIVVGSKLVPGWGQEDWQDPLPDALEPVLVERFGRAQESAQQDGITMTITSGWRSAQTQQELFDDAIETHGSVAEATRWVLPPERSAHVWGRAIDVAPAAGVQWLQANGSQFGLCQVYENEPWHFEALVEPGLACPGLVADAASH